MAHHGEFLGRSHHLGLRSPYSAGRFVVWFVLLSVFIVVALMVAALVSDLRRRAKLRRMGEPLLGSGSNAAAHQARARFDVRSSRVVGQQQAGYGGDPSGPDR